MRAPPRAATKAGLLAAAIACLPVAGCGFGGGGSTLSTTGDAGSSTGAPVAMTLGTASTVTSSPTTGNPTSSGAAVSSGGDASSTGPEETSTGERRTGEDSGSSTTGATPGLGDISGRCGVLTSADFDAPTPRFIVNAIDFGRVGFDYDMLTPGGQEVHDEGNLGGSSLLSEVMSFDVLARCEGVSLLKTEAEIVYDDDAGPKTDLLIDSDGVQVGVSVTRAVAFPFEDPYPAEAAATLLEDKLAGVLASSANVSAGDAWPKQILHILAYAPMHADVLQAAYAALDPALQADTIVWVTVTNGDDLFVYD